MDVAFSVPRDCPETPAAPPLLPLLPGYGPLEGTGTWRLQWSSCLPNRGPPREPKDRGRSQSSSCHLLFPTQGLEIVNPQAAEKKVAEANQKYFSSMAEFLKVKSEKGGITST